MEDKSGAILLALGGAAAFWLLSQRGGGLLGPPAPLPVPPIPIGGTVPPVEGTPPEDPTSGGVLTTAPISSVGAQSQLTVTLSGVRGADRTELRAAQGNYQGPRTAWIKVAEGSGNITGTVTPGALGSQAAIWVQAVLYRGGVVVKTYLIGLGIMYGGGGEDGQSE